MCATSDDLARGDSDAVDHLILHKEPGQSVKDLNVYGYQVRFENKFKETRLGFFCYDLHDYCIPLSLFFIIIFVFI